jgi:hypothetical protein
VEAVVSNEQLPRTVLPIPDQAHVGLTTYDAKDPGTNYGKRGTKFTGEVNWVEIDIGKDAINLDHLITPEQRLNLAMARQ